MKALVLHGFTGSLDTVNLLGERLEDKGIEVALPVLRGHGTTPDALFRVHWRDWVCDARQALLKLDPEGREEIAIAGLSMGALVACVLAAEFPNRIRRLALIAPAFEFRSKLTHLVPVFQRLYRYWSGNPEYADPELMFTDTNYERFPIEAFKQLLDLSQVSRDLLPSIECPVGIFYSHRDPVVAPRSLKVIDQKLGSGPSEHYFYKRSYHEMLRDIEADAVCDDVTEFLTRQTSA